jgi:DNA-binding Xre family transcriptional regulator
LLYGDYIPLIKGIITPIIERVKGDGNMIKFDRLWQTMERKQVTTYQLRERCGIDSKTIRRLRANDNMETKTLNKLCEALDCGLDEIAEYVKEV